VRQYPNSAISGAFWLRQTLPYLTLSQRCELALGAHNN
jgi:hypothetical protein